MKVGDEVVLADLKRGKVWDVRIDAIDGERAEVTVIDNPAMRFKTHVSFLNERQVKS